ncbi:MAG: AAA family ATPase [Nitrososphaerota archaeon]|nr:AAA family ATPase [Nitrososphaerota archaeon]
MYQQFFSDEYLPKTIIDRESEQEAIASFLKDVLFNKSSRVLYVHGHSGVGKSTVVKHVLEQFEDSNENSVVAYLSCTSSTPYLCLKEIHSKVCGLLNKRLTSQELVSEVVRRLLVKKFALIVVLDNFDKMQDVEQLLWSFNEMMQKLSRFGLILVSTSKFELMDMVGERLYSRLRPEILEFKPYSADRLFEIMKGRTIEAYGKPIADDNALQKIAEFVETNGGSARHALKILLEAIEVAQRLELSRITIEVVKKVLEEEEKDLLLSELHELKEEAPREFEVLKVIAELTAKEENIYTGLIEQVIKERGLMVCRRSLEYYLNDLQRRGFVKLSSIRINKGHSTKIELVIPENLLL